MYFENNTLRKGAQKILVNLTYDLRSICFHSPLLFGRENILTLWLFKANVYLKCDVFVREKFVCGLFVKTEIQLSFDEKTTDYLFNCCFVYDVFGEKILKTLFSIVTRSTGV